MTTVGHRLNYEQRCHPGNGRTKGKLTHTRIAAFRRELTVRGSRWRRKHTWFDYFRLQTCFKVMRSKEINNFSVMCRYAFEGRRTGNFHRSPPIFHINLLDLSSLFSGSILFVCSTTKNRFQWVIPRKPLLLHRRLPLQNRYTGPDTGLSPLLSPTLRTLELGFCRWVGPSCDVIEPNWQAPSNRKRTHSTHWLGCGPPRK